MHYASYCSFKQKTPIAPAYRPGCHTPRKECLDSWGVARLGSCKERLLQRELRQPSPPGSRTLEARRGYCARGSPGFPRGDMNLSRSVSGNGPAARQPRLCLTWESRLPPPRRQAAHCPTPARGGGSRGTSTSSASRPAATRGSPRGSDGTGSGATAARSPFPAPPCPIPSRPALSRPVPAPSRRGAVTGPSVPSVLVAGEELKEEGGPRQTDLARAAGKRVGEAKEKAHYTTRSRM